MDCVVKLVMLLRILENKNSIFEKASSDILSGDEKLAAQLQAEELENAGYKPK